MSAQVTLKTSRTAKNSLTGRGGRPMVITLNLLCILTSESAWTGSRTGRPGRDDEPLRMGL